MSTANFLACFTETESYEGGYVNNPHDPGGATLKGVTQAVYTAWRRSQSLNNQPVRLATDSEIQAIYRTQYWNPVRGDDLPAGLDLLMVDYGWGSGPVTAIRALQHELGVIVDGQFGLGTLTAVRSIQPDDRGAFIAALAARRLRLFQSLPTWRYFGVGWTHRLTGITAKALFMNSQANP